MADTVPDSTAEGRIINRVWRLLGDMNPDDRQHSSSEMWLWLRDAVEEVGSDLSDWSPESITEASDFTISPAPDEDQQQLLVLKMIELITASDYRELKEIGGVTIRGGMDTIDTREAIRQARLDAEASSKAYREALLHYNLGGSASGSAVDLYSTGGELSEVN